MNDEPAGKRAIEVKKIKVVDFYGDAVPAAQGSDSEIYVPINPLSTSLGLDRSAQQRRIRRDPVLGEKVCIIRIDTGGGPQEQVCLPLNMLPGWLFGITTGKMSAELQMKLNRYRREAFNVLWNAFKEEILPAAQPKTTGLTAAQQTLDMIRAMEHLAEQQVEIEAHVTQLEGRQGTLESYMRGFIQDTRSRLTAIELRLDPAAVITEEQAAQLAIAVKSLAFELEARGKVGTYQSGYARVYSELYRRFDVKTYKNLRRDRYDAAISWLRQWYDEVTKGGKPEGELAAPARMQAHALTVGAE